MTPALPMLVHGNGAMGTVGNSPIRPADSRLIDSGSADGIDTDIDTDTDTDVHQPPAKARRPFGGDQPCCPIAVLSIITFPKPKKVEEKTRKAKMKCHQVAKKRN